MWISWGIIATACTWCYHKRDKPVEKGGKKLASLQAEFKGTMEIPSSQIALELTALSWERVMENAKKELIHEN